MNIFEEFIFLTIYCYLRTLCSLMRSFGTHDFIYISSMNLFPHVIFEFIGFNYMEIVPLGFLLRLEILSLWAFVILRWGIRYSRLRSFYWVFEDLVFFSSRFISWRIRLKPRRFMIWSLGSVFWYFSMRGWWFTLVMIWPPYGYP